MTPLAFLDAARDIASLILLGWLLHREAIHRRALSLLMASTPTHVLERARRKLESVDLAETLEEDPYTLLDEARDELQRAYLAIASLLRREPPASLSTTIPSAPDAPTPRRLQ